MAPPWHLTRNHCRRPWAGAGEIEFTGGLHGETQAPRRKTIWLPDPRGASTRPRRPGSLSRRSRTHHHLSRLLSCPLIHGCQQHRPGTCSQRSRPGNGASGQPPDGERCEPRAARGRGKSPLTGRVARRRQKMDPGPPPAEPPVRPVPTTAGSDLGQLSARYLDPYPPWAEVDDQRVVVPDEDDAAKPIPVVRHPVLHRILLCRRLGDGLFVEGTFGQETPGGGAFRLHLFQYAPAQALLFISSAWLCRAVTSQRPRRRRKSRPKVPPLRAPSPLWRGRSPAGWSSARAAGPVRRVRRRSSAAVPTAG